MRQAASLAKESLSSDWIRTNSIHVEYNSHSDYETREERRSNESIDYGVLECRKQLDTPSPIPSPSIQQSFLQSAMRYQMIPNQLSVQFLLKLQTPLETNKSQIQVYCITMTWSPQSVTLWDLIVRVTEELSLPSSVCSRILKVLLKAFSKVAYTVYIFIYLQSRKALFFPFFPKLHGSIRK